MITLLLLDLITGHMQPFREYVEQTVIVGVLVGVGWVLNDTCLNARMLTNRFEISHEIILKNSIVKTLR